MKEDSVERDYSFLKEWTEPQAYRDPPDVAFVLWIERMAEPTAEQTVTNDHFWNNLAKLAKRYLQLATTTDPDSAKEGHRCLSDGCGSLSRFRPCVRADGCGFRIVRSPRAYRVARPLGTRLS